MLCLVVDDSQTIRKIGRKIVEELGFVCAEAADGAEAYEACKKAMPDMVLLDWNMPNVDGLQFLQMLRGMEKGSHPKVVFCTTENSMEFIQRGMQAGADEYVMKPFDKSIIEGKLVQLGLIEEKL